MDENEIAKIVFELGLEVHRRLGAGLLESAYLECLYYEIVEAGLQVEKQKPLPLVYENVRMDIGYRVDLIIENKFIVEVKSVEELNEVYLSQIPTYLRLSGCKLGYLMNFNTAL